MLEAVVRVYGKQSRDADRVVYLVDLHILNSVAFIHLLLSSSNPTIRQRCCLYQRILMIAYTVFFWFLFLLFLLNMFTPRLYISSAETMTSQQNP